MLKSKAIDLAKQAATGLLMKLFTFPPTPKAPKPPWMGLGKVAAPGSTVASNATEAYSAAHKAPIISNGSCAGGGAGGAGGGAGSAGGTSGSPSQSPTANSPYPYDPRGAPASREEWEKYLGLPGGFLPDYDPNNPDAFDHLDTLPLEEPWYASILGGNMEDGYTALFGLIELGSPKWPGAGNHDTWWVPDKIFGYDMSPFFSLHDERFDSSRDLSDMGDILGTEFVTFLAGLAHTRDPIHVALQAVYSTATLLTSLGFGVKNQFFRKNDEERARDALRDHFRRRR